MFGIIKEIIQSNIAKQRQTSKTLWLEHVVHRLKQELLKQDYLHIDETHVQVLKEPGRKNTSASYMWVYCSIKEEANPVRYFEYQPGRGGKYQEVFLTGYHGYIHTDA